MKRSLLFESEKKELIFYWPPQVQLKTYFFTHEVAFFNRGYNSRKFFAGILTL